MWWFVPHTSTQENVIFNKKSLCICHPKKDLSSTDDKSLYDSHKIMKWHWKKQQRHEIKLYKQPSQKTCKTLLIASLLNCFLMQPICIGITLLVPKKQRSTCVDLTLKKKKMISLMTNLCMLIWIFPLHGLVNMVWHIARPLTLNSQKQGSIAM